MQSIGRWNRYSHDGEIRESELTGEDRVADSKIFSFIQVLFICVIVGFTTSSFILITVTKIFVKHLVG